MSLHNRIGAPLLLSCAVLTLASCSEHVPPPEPSSPAQQTTPARAEPPAVVRKGIVPEPSALSQLKTDKPVASCHIDSLSAGGASAVPGTPLEIPAGSSLDVAGWVAYPEEDAIPNAVTLRLLAAGDSGKVWQFKSSTGVDRSDVAAFKKNPALANSGFAFTADVSSLEAGTYHAYLAFERGSQAFSCNGGDTIIIGE